MSADPTGDGMHHLSEYTDGIDNPLAVEEEAKRLGIDVAAASDDEAEAANPTGALEGGAGASGAGDLTERCAQATRWRRASTCASWARRS